MSNAIEVKSFACASCGIAYTQVEVAERCCRCSRCGLPTDRKVDFTGLHRGCSDLNRAESEARSLAKAEKLETWDGPVVEGDRYFETLDHYVEYLDEELDPGDPWPEWVHVCTVSPFPPMDMDDILGDLCENHNVEDFDTSDLQVSKETWDRLRDAMRAFNEETSGSQSWNEDAGRVVRVPPREPQAA